MLVEAHLKVLKQIRDTDPKYTSLLMKVENSISDYITEFSSKNEKKIHLLSEGIKMVKSKETVYKSKISKLESDLERLKIEMKTQEERIIKESLKKLKFEEMNEYVEQVVEYLEKI